MQKQPDLMFAFRLRVAECSVGFGEGPDQTFRFHVHLALQLLHNLLSQFVEGLFGVPSVLGCPRFSGQRPLLSLLTPLASRIISLGEAGLDDSSEGIGENPVPERVGCKERGRGWLS